MLVSHWFWRPVHFAERPLLNFGFASELLKASHILITYIKCSELQLHIAHLFSVLTISNRFFLCSVIFAEFCLFYSFQKALFFACLVF